VNPTRDLDLPEAGGVREWHGTPADALARIDALPKAHRALWATAFFAGLRRGELRALRVRDLRNLTAEDSEPSINIERSWDDKEGEVSPKSAAGTRVVPVPETLRTMLVEHIRRTRRTDDDFVFGATGESPFSPSYIRATADSAWETHGLERVTLHQCRHGYASFLDAAGVSEARADRYLGHAGTTVGDRYRHRLRGQLESDAALLDAYLTGAGAEVIALPTGAHSGAHAANIAPLSQSARAS
jgi:integrase